LLLTDGIRSSLHLAWAQLALTFSSYIHVLCFNALLLFSNVDPLVLLALIPKVVIVIVIIVVILRVVLLAATIASTDCPRISPP
jgi:hypothetical protein